MICLSIDHRWRVNCTAEIEIPLSASVVWGQMRDLRRFICIDPLHASVRTADGGPVLPGSKFVIQHRFLGIGPDRASRVLRWREGTGYAVSDLSRRGPHVGFPHICTYDVFPITPVRCHLRIGARGRWTATWLPRWIAKGWMWWILAATQAHLRNELAALDRWLVRQA